MEHVTLKSGDHPYIMRRPEVLARTGLGEQTARDLERAGKFPRRFRLGNGYSVGWRSDEIQAWIDAQFSNLVDVAAIAA